MQDTNIDYQYKYREILQTSTSFEEVQDRIDTLINYSGAYFKINSVHYVKYPVEGFKVFYSVGVHFLQRDKSYSELKNFLRGFSDTAGFLLFKFHDVPLISEKVMSCLVSIRGLAAIAEYHEECCNEDHRFELNEIQKESKELRNRLNFLVQKENKILQEIRNEVDQFIKRSISDIDILYSTEESSIKFLTENPTKTTLLAILQEQGSKDV
jgi:hypothetical protein